MAPLQAHGKMTSFPVQTDVSLPPLNFSTIEAVGFDLGETLLFYRDTPLSWASLYEPALSRVAAKCALQPSVSEIAAGCEILRQHNTRVVPRQVEVGADFILGAVLTAWQARISPDLLATAIQTFFGFFQQRMCAYPDTQLVLANLAARGLPLGILTDVPYGMPAAFVRDDLRAVSIEQYFGVVLTSCEVGWRKPEPVGFAALAEKLGTTPAKMIFVGNEPKDVQGAQRAGAYAVFLDHNGTGINHGQHSTVLRLNDVLTQLG